MMPSIRRGIAVRRRTPPTLRWLATKRAELAGDIERLTRMKAEVEIRLSQATESLAVIEGSLKLYDSKLKPERIEPIAGRKNKYGRHGSLRQSIAKVLENVEPASIATDELALMLALHFGFEFAASPERAKWVKNSLSPTLRALVQDGLVVREHDPAAADSRPGRWRWKGESGLSLDELREKAGAADEAAATTARFRF